MQSTTLSKSRSKAQTLTFGLKKEAKFFTTSCSTGAPMFCSICDCMLSNSIDTESFDRVGCCRDCESDFAELNLVEWKMGKRPSEEQIKMKIKEREALALARYLELER